MKKTILSLVMIGSLGMTQAQNAFQSEPVYAPANELGVSNSVSEVTNSLNDISMSPLETVEYKESPLDMNIDYLTEVQSPVTPTSVRKYQIMASLYDVTQSRVFDGRTEPFQMVFKTEKGTIMTTYNWKGEVLTSEEKFRNVSLPNKMLRNVLKDYEGWQVVRTNYYVSYNKDKKSRTYYKVQITDGKKKKNISMESEGIL